MNEPTAPTLWSASGINEPGKAWNTWISSGHTLRVTSTPLSRMRSANPVASSMSTSYSPTSMHTGGKPPKSAANRGEANSVRGSTPSR